MNTWNSLVWIDFVSLTCFEQRKHKKIPKLSHHQQFLMEGVQTQHQWKYFVLCACIFASTRRRDMALSVWTALFLLLAPIAQRSLCAVWAGKTPFHFRFSPSNGATSAAVEGEGSGGEGRPGTHFMQMNSRPINILFQLCSVFPLSYLSECGRK